MALRVCFRRISIRTSLIGVVVWLVALYFIFRSSDEELDSQSVNSRDDPQFEFFKQPILEQPNLDKLHFEQAMRENLAADQQEKLRQEKERGIEEDIAKKHAINRQEPFFERDIKRKSDLPSTTTKRSFFGFLFNNNNQVKKPVDQGFGIHGQNQDSKINELIESGLVIPKWNIDVEAPEKPDAPGEQGQAITINKETLSASDREKFEQGMERNAFNQYASDITSLHRSLPDVRESECKSLKYRDNLPDTSVIIIFHNEAWSTLLRTVHSVLDRSPPHLIKDIILVDDFSDQDHLKVQLDEYIAKLQKVKIVRGKSRQGLIRARLLGASQATGKVLTFLDSHCECTMGWLEPLLDRIAQNWTNVATPIIDVIDDNTLKFLHNNARSTSVGGFDWNLQFNWHGIPQSEVDRRKSDIEPVRSPTMAGGLFSISREYFEYLGTYDPGMDIWGGENLELSFRIWMCGGTLEIVICSHVGHIFRLRSPYKWRSGENVLRKNTVRLAEVWMDDYKNYYYERLNYDIGDYGDVSARKELRKRLNCKSFEWYLTNIYPEQFIPGESLASGEVRNKALGVFSGARQPVCLDASVSGGGLNKPVNLWPCHNMGGNQYWMLSKHGEIRRDEACLDFNGKEIMVFTCHNNKGNQYWEYRDDNTIYLPGHERCMELSADGLRLTMQRCSGIDRQAWLWKRKTSHDKKSSLKNL